MAICDVCSKPMNRGDGYVLTTRQVVSSVEYWVKASNTWKTMAPAQLDFEMILKRQCFQSTGWTVCDVCTGDFPDADQTNAGRYAKEFWDGGGGTYSPPGGGSVAPHEAREYAQTSWKRVTGSSEKKSGSCFIATACYGTPDYTEIAALRCFRDEILIHSDLGRMFVSLYYKNAPPFADWISCRPTYRKIISRALVAPVAWFAEKIIGQNIKL